MSLSFFFSMVFLLAPCCCCFFGGISIARSRLGHSSSGLGVRGRQITSFQRYRSSFRNQDQEWMLVTMKRRSERWTATMKKSLKLTTSPTPRPGKGLTDHKRSRSLELNYSPSLSLLTLRSVQLHSRYREDHPPVGSLSG